MSPRHVFAFRILASLGLVGGAVACSSAGADAVTKPLETNPTCMNGVKDGTESGIDCGGSCVTACGEPGTPGNPGNPGNPANPDGGPGTPGRVDGVKDGDETDIDCGGTSAPKCTEGKSCLVDADCNGACNYANKCVVAPSCKSHFGGDTCGKGEVGEAGASHESCCRTLAVPGFTDPAHPGKTVYLDKYEITAGRIRAFIEQLAAEKAGNPDVKAWIAEHPQSVWDPSWNTFLPSDYEGGEITIPRRLLGDPRPEDNGGGVGPGVTLPPATDQVRKLGVNTQFGSQVYAYLHGNNCGVWANAYGFPTYYYPPEVLARNNEAPRPDPIGLNGEVIPAKDSLDTKSMNCVTNAMLAAFCAWDGGQLATDDVLDFVTETPASLGSISGCGTQYDNHDELLGNNFSHTVQTGGRCPAVALINATFDAGDSLPVKNSPLNVHNYNFPDLSAANNDKTWQISAPGRASRAAGANGEQVDAIRINPGDEPWIDLAGNLSEAAIDTSKPGAFTLKFRGIGYGSSRSALNVGPINGETVRRIQRPEAKGGYTGGRCMRFR